MKKSEVNKTSAEIVEDTTEITHIEDHIWIDNELDGESDNELDPTNNTSGTFIQDIFNSTDDGSSNATTTTTSTNVPTTEIDRIFNFTRPADPEIDPTTNGSIYQSGPITTPQQQQTIPPAWDTRIPPYNNEQYTPRFPEANMIIVGVLIALIVVLGMVLGVVTIPPLIHFFRRKIPVSQKRIDRRYATIDGWLITKVRLATNVNSDLRGMAPVTATLTSHPIVFHLVIFIPYPLLLSVAFAPVYEDNKTPQ